MSELADLSLNRHRPLSFITRPPSVLDLLDFHSVQDGEVERVFAEVVRGQLVNEAAVQTLLFAEVGQLSEPTLPEAANRVSYRQGGEGGGFRGGRETGDRGHRAGRFTVSVTIEKFLVNQDQALSKFLKRKMTRSVLYIVTDLILLRGDMNRKVVV